MTSNRKTGIVLTMKSIPMEQITIEDRNLRIGDVVRLLCTGEVVDTGFNQLVVINKTEEAITFFRPYVSLGDFTYTGGVIPYIGIERFDAPFRGAVYILLDNIYREKAI